MSKVPFVVICLCLAFRGLMGQNQIWLVNNLPADLKLVDIKSQWQNFDLDILVYWPGGALVRGDSELVMKGELPLFSEVIVRPFEWDQEVLIPNQTAEEGFCGNLEVMDQNGFDQIHSRSLGLSDRIEGHTVCALLMLNHVTGLQRWTTEDVQQVMQNTAINLMFWVDQASRYGVEASFEIIPYLPDDPVCQISVDPTIASGWQNDVLNALGYFQGSVNDREIAFVRDLIDLHQSDWGFMAYILRGANPYRSNANLFGPSTRISYPASRSGFTTAHEVGHIFGLQDEYEERASFVHSYVLNGLANLNADFRNPVNAPCIMKVATSHAGICSYNAVHLHFTNLIHQVEVHPDPEDGIFLVDYLTSTGSNYIVGRPFQGKVALPLGLGARARIRGLDQIAVESGQYQNPVVNSHTGAYEFEVISPLHEINIRYNYEKPASQYVAYLPHGETYVGKRFHRIEVLRDALFVCSDHAITRYHPQQGLDTLDKVKTGRPGDQQGIKVYRLGRSITTASDGSIIIGAREGNTLPEILEIKQNNQEISMMPPSSFRTIGFYAAADKSEQSEYFAVFSEGGVHVYNPSGGFQIITDREGLPHNQVTALCIDASNTVWLGFGKDRSGQGFGDIYLMNPVTKQIFRDNRIPVELLNKEYRLFKKFDQGNTLVFISSSQFFVLSEGKLSSYELPGTVINDVDRISSDRYAVATNIGLYYMDEDLRWVHCTANSHNLQENFCLSVKALPNDIFLVGHLTAGITALYLERSLVSIEESMPSSHHFVVFPNPCHGEEIYIKTGGNPNVQLNIEIYDLMGHLRIHKTIFSADENVIRVDGLNNFKAGVYLIKINGKGQLFSIVR